MPDQSTNNCQVDPGDKIMPDPVLRVSGTDPTQTRPHVTLLTGMTDAGVFRVSYIPPSRPAAISNTVNSFITSRFPAYRSRFGMTDKEYYDSEEGVDKRTHGWAKAGVYGRLLSYEMPTESTQRAEDANSWFGDEVRKWKLYNALGFTVHSEAVANEVERKRRIEEVSDEVEAKGNGVNADDIDFTC